MERPHRVVGSVADGVLNGVQGLGDGLGNTIRQAGATLMNALDKPWEATLHIQGPHRIADRLANGTADALQSVFDQGVIGTTKKAGAGIMRALDQPLDDLDTVRLPSKR